MATLEDETEHLQTVASLADAPEGEVVQAVIKRQRLIQTRYSLAKKDFLSPQEITELAQEITTFNKLIARVIESFNISLPEGALEKLAQGQVSFKAIHRLLAKDQTHKTGRYQALSDIFARFDNVPVQQDEDDLDLPESPTALTQKDTTVEATPEATPTQKPDPSPER